MLKYKIIPDDIVKNMIEFLDEIQFEAAAGNKPDDLHRINFINYLISELMNGLDGFDHHGLIYSGPLDINLLKKRMDKLIKYKRPDRIYQVKEEFWALNIKISRDHMSERIGNNREYIVSEI